MASMIDWAKNELELLEKQCTEGDGLEMQKLMSEDIMELITKFVYQGHTGTTAAYAIGIFSRLASWRPLTALTGEDDEWNEIRDGFYQNRRYSAVFKEDGRAYNTEGRIFSDNGGESFFGTDLSRRYIEFPYTVPKEPEKFIFNTRDEYEAWRNKEVWRGTT